jgi:hypothetical protein
MGPHGRDRMVIGFKTTIVISAYTTKDVSSKPIRNVCMNN